MKIKADAKWNDGTPVTAKDVAATYHAHVDYNSSTGAEMKSYIADVVAQDDSTVVFKLTTDDSGEAVNPVLAERYLPMLYATRSPPAHWNAAWITKRCRPSSVTTR